MYIFFLFLIWSYGSISDSLVKIMTQLLDRDNIKFEFKNYDFVLTFISFFFFFNFQMFISHFF